MMERFLGWKVGHIKVDITSWDAAPIWNIAPREWCLVIGVWLLGLKKNCVPSGVFFQVCTWFWSVLEQNGCTQLPISNCLQYWTVYWFMYKLCPISLQPGGSAQVSSKLEVGHVIVSVNGRDMRGLNHQQATRIIAEEFKNKKVQSLEFLVVDSNKYKILYWLNGESLSEYSTWQLIWKSIFIMAVSL